MANQPFSKDAPAIFWLKSLDPQIERFGVRFEAIGLKKWLFPLPFFAFPLPN
jgi:hypothetical protein